MAERRPSALDGNRAGASAVQEDARGADRAAEPVAERCEPVRIGDWTLNLSTGELTTGDRRAILQLQPFRVLVRLLERPGELVTRDQLRRELWHGETFVDFEHSLNAAVKRLREALGDLAATPRYIETLPRRGYRLIAPVAVPRPDRGASARRIFRISSIGTAAVILAAAIALVGVQAVKRSRQTGVGPRFQSVAVLPFRNLTGDARLDVVIDGLHEDVLDGLARLGSIRVTSLTSAMHYRNTTRLAGEIASELHVSALVEGTYRQVDGMPRVDVRLVDAGRDTLLWSASYDNASRDVFAVSSRVVQDLASPLEIQLTLRQTARLAHGGTLSGSAEQSYLRGRYDVKRMQQGKDTREAMYNSLDEAIRLAPGFAPAHAARAYAHAYEGRAGFAVPNEAFDLARRDATRALELDPTLEEARAALGLSRLYLEWNWDAAGRELHEAMALNPNNSWLRVFYSDYLLIVGRIEEAMTHSRRALELDPLSAVAAASVGGALAAAGRFDEAVSVCRMGREHEPASLAAGSCIEDNLYWSGHETEALQLVIRRLGSSPAAGVLDRALVSGGPKVAMRALGDYYAAVSQRGGMVEPFNMARFYAAAGDGDRAFEWLNRAVSERAPLVLQLQTTWDFEPWRSDRRYQDLVHRIGYPPLPQAEARH